jgi:hypothetical protein
MIKGRIKRRKRGGIDDEEERNRFLQSIWWRASGEGRRWSSSAGKRSGRLEVEDDNVSLSWADWATAERAGEELGRSPRERGKEGGPEERRSAREGGGTRERERERERGSEGKRSGLWAENGPKRRENYF